MNLYISSRDSTDLYPQNTASNFRVQLPKYIQLDEGNWTCGVTQCVLPSRPTDPVYITGDFIESSVFGERLQPILCMVTAKTKEFQHIDYTRVKSHQFSTLHLKLVNRHGDEVVTGKGTTFIVLDFKK
jgi:hypothetical protein